MPKPTGAKLGIRIKPGTEKSCVELSKKAVVVSDPRKREDDITLPISFGFTAKHSNKHVSESLLGTLVTKGLSGVDSVVLMYGSDGTGKSYTMFSKNGLVESVVKGVFTAVPDDAPMSVVVSLSAYMIQGDDITDLVMPTQAPHIEDHPVLGTRVEDGSELVVTTAEEASMVMRQVAACRNAKVSQNPELDAAAVIVRLFLSCESGTSALREDNTAEVLFVDLPTPLPDGSKPPPAKAMVDFIAGQCKKDPGLAGDGLTHYLAERMSSALVMMLVHIDPSPERFKETAAVLQSARTMSSVKRAMDPHVNVRQKALRSLIAEQADVETDHAATLKLLREVKAAMNDELVLATRRHVEMRAQALDDAGVLEVVREVAVGDHKAMQARLDELSENRKGLMKQYSTQKDAVTAARREVEMKVATYNSVVGQTGPASGAARAAMKAVDAARADWKTASAPLQTFKDQLKAISADSAAIEESLGRAESFLDIHRGEEEHTALEAVRRDGVAFLDAEKKRLWEVAEAAKDSLKGSVAGKEETETVPLKEVVDLKLQMIQLRADKDFLVSRLSVANTELQHLDSSLQEAAIDHAAALEERELSHLVVFRQYRVEHEARLRELRRKAQAAVDELGKNGKKLAERNRALRTEVARLKALK